MKSKQVPFVIAKVPGQYIKTLAFDFYMFLLLITYYVLCLSLGPLALLMDTIFKTKKVTNSLKKFFDYLGNL